MRPQNGLRTTDPRATRRWPCSWATATRRISFATSKRSSACHLRRTRVPPFDAAENDKPEGLTRCANALWDDHRLSPIAISRLTSLLFPEPTHLARLLIKASRDP